MKRVLVVLILGLIIGVLIGCPPKPTPAPIAPTPTLTPKAEVIHLYMGSTSSVSGLYVYPVAVARAINKADPGIHITVVESGAAIDNLRRVREGTFHFALMVDVPSAMQLYRGIDVFKGEPWEPLRFLLLRNPIADRLYVRADMAEKLGIKTFADLRDKKFNPGLPGSSSAEYVRRINEVLGTRVDLFEASLADAIKALKEGRIVGMQKSSPIDAFDASMLEVHLLTPLTVIGYAKEDIPKIQALYPYMSFRETPAGSIKELPKLGAVIEKTPLVGSVASSRLPEDVVYRIVKAYMANFDAIAAAFPPIKPWHPIADYIKLVAPGGEVPLHAGVVRYAKEVGIEVPERFIPPEYKGR